MKPDEKHSAFMFDLVSQYLPADDDTYKQDDTISTAEFLLWLGAACLSLLVYGILDGFTIS